MSGMIGHGNKWLIKLLNHIEPERPYDPDLLLDVLLVEDEYEEMEDSPAELEESSEESSEISFDSSREEDSSEDSSDSPLVCSDGFSGIEIVPI